MISGSGMMVMPGLVNIHSHPSSEPMNKGLIDEIGSPGFYNSSLYEYLAMRCFGGGGGGAPPRSRSGARLCPPPPSFNRIASGISNTGKHGGLYALDLMVNRLVENTNPWVDREILCSEVQSRWEGWEEVMPVE